MHYSTLDAFNATAWVSRLSCGVWSVMIRIPDNPETKCKAKFKYEQDLDALDYGWRLVNELVEVVELAVAEFKPKGEV
jgi:hypothetical protein